MFEIKKLISDDIFRKPGVRSRSETQEVSSKYQSISEREFGIPQENKLLDAHLEEIFDRITGQVGRVLKAPIELVSLVTPSRQIFRSQAKLSNFSLDTLSGELAGSPCLHTVSNSAPLVINDTRRDPLAKDKLTVEHPGILAYLGVPLRSPQNEIIGAICAIGLTPRVWSINDLTTMLDVADMLSCEVASLLQTRAN